MIPAHAWARSPNGGSRSGDLLLGQLALGVVLVIGLAGVVCWCGAQLGAVVSGHGWMQVGAASGGSALLALPHHLSEPAAAWPAGARSALPGPIIYWICSGAVAVTVAGSGAWVALWWWRRSSRRGSALGIAPHAGFARASDLRRLTVRAPEPGRLTLGHSGRHLLAAEPRVSLAVIGPTGCGKTAGFAIPALLEWNGPIIATSVKADLIDASIEHRTEKGQGLDLRPDRIIAAATPRAGHRSTNAARGRERCGSPPGCAKPRSRASTPSTTATTGTPRRAGRSRHTCTPPHSPVRRCATSSAGSMRKSRPRSGRSWTTTARSRRRSDVSPQARTDRSDGANFTTEPTKRSSRACAPGPPRHRRDATRLGDAGQKRMAACGRQRTGRAGRTAARPGGHRRFATQPMRRSAGSPASSTLSSSPSRSGRRKSACAARSSPRPRT